MNLRRAIVCLSLLAVLAITTQALADNAEVLPKGTSRVGLVGKFYIPVDERFRDNGNAANPAYKYNANLNSNVFPALRPYDAIFGPGGSTLGQSNVTFKYDFQIYELTIQYGITDKLSFGAMIPYWFVTNTVTTSLDTSRATIGMNPGAGPPLIPIRSGGVPLTPQQVKQLLYTTYGYKPFETFHNDGLADIEAGFKYQYLRNDNWRLAATVGVKMPTGKADDPDDLVDYPLGGGVWAICFRLHNDYVGIKNLVVDLTLKYDWTLEDKTVMRIPSDVSQPITANKEEVSRNTGDVLGLDASVQYEFFKGFTVGLRYELGYRYQASIQGTRGYAYRQAELETDYREQVFTVGIGYNTLAFYKENQFPVPLTFGVAYRNRFEGFNTLHSQYFEVGLGVYF